jgi:hypothetical protein
MDDVVTLYTRRLPGGGMVKIEVAPTPAQPHPPDYQARVCVERRSDPKRREGHTPPVIAEAVAPTQALALAELFGIASDNVAVARGLIRWQAHRGPTAPGNID